MSGDRPERINERRQADRSADPAELRRHLQSAAVQLA
jgi:hypothetical protein